MLVRRFHPPLFDNISLRIYTDEASKTPEECYYDILKDFCLEIIPCLFPVALVNINGVTFFQISIMAIVCFRIKEKEPGIATRLFFWDYSILSAEN